MNKQRSRGRNNSNNNNQRRGGGGNPLSRNYESNGPDVKIRGNAAHIAEKYAQLARDAAASGDNVMAENYLQHAEHYNRIILAAQAQFQPRQDQQADSTNEEDGTEETAKSEPMAQGTPTEDQTEESSAQEAKPRRVPRPRRPRREKLEEPASADQESPVAEPKSTESAEANSATDDEEKPKRPVRRTPRRTTKAVEAEADSGPGELPAFLTAGREAAAE